MTEKVIELYQDGETIEDISTDLDISKYHVAKTLHKNNVKIRPAHTKIMPEGIKQMITNDWNAGYTVERISNTYGYSKGYIRNILHKLRQEGYNLKSRRRQREEQAEGVAKDWNAGMATGDIANKYGFNTKGAVHNFIRKLRISGYEIERRRKNTK